MLRGSRKLGTIQVITHEDAVSYGLDDIYSLYLPSSPRKPVEAPPMSTLPEKGVSESPRIEVQIDDAVHSSPEEPGTAQWNTTVTGSPRSKKLQGGFAKYRDSPIVHRASHSLSSLRLHPSQNPKRTYIWDPLHSEWTILDKEEELDETPDDGPSDSSTTGQQYKNHGSLSPAKSIRLNRHVSEPLTPQVIVDPPSEWEDYDSHPTLEFALRYAQPSPINLHFDFNSKLAENAGVDTSTRRLLVNIIGAYNLAEIEVRRYASITIGEKSYRTSLSERTAIPEWSDRDFIFDYVKDGDEVLIELWSCTGSREKPALQGLFTCTVKRLIFMQTVNEILTLTLDPWSNETDFLHLGQSGSINIIVKDISVSEPATLSPMANSLRPSSTLASPSHSSVHSLSPLYLPSSNDRSHPSPRFASLAPGKSEGNFTSPWSAVSAVDDSYPHPKWFTDIVGRTVSMKRGRYPWVPTGDITIINGPVCGGRYCDIYIGELKNKEKKRPQGSTRVALKQLRVFVNASDRMRKMFCHEVRFWSRLRHPNVSPFWGCWELDKYRLFMVSPWASNGNSMQYVKKHPDADRRRILLQTADALAYLHSGLDGPAVIHGDLKADNVLISANGDALLADFGLARYVEKLAAVSSVTPSGISAHGHIRFSAPELLFPASEEECRPTTQSDVFAFGCLIIQIFTEELPFAEIKVDPQVITQIVLGKIPRRPTGLAEERGLDNFIWKLSQDCWQFKPEKRPSMGNVATRLRRPVHTLI